MQDKQRISQLLREIENHHLKKHLKPMLTVEIMNARKVLNIINSHKAPPETIVISPREINEVSPILKVTLILISKTIYPLYLMSLSFQSTTSNFGERHLAGIQFILKIGLEI